MRSTLALFALVLVTAGAAAAKENVEATLLGAVPREAAAGSSVQFKIDGLTFSRSIVFRATGSR